ncbi:RICIN domain-containing protein [Kutzneria kofuensis]|uniref:RICIN domain-containing protein n=1 Tax=Kutzneria kofuensis TaxID=103725 RepID=UPI0031ED1887
MDRPPGRQPALDSDPARRQRVHRRQRGSGKCLDDPAGSTAQGTQLDQRTCDGGAGQQWALDAVGDYASSADASYLFVNLGSGWVADVSGGSASAGAPVVQWTTNGGSNQTWTLSR